MVGSRQVCVCPVCEGFLDWGAGVYPSEMPDLSQPVRPPGVTESTRFGSTPPGTGYLNESLRTGGHAPPTGGSMETTTTAGGLNYLREKKVRSSWSYEASRNITRLSASES